MQRKKLRKKESREISRIVQENAGVLVEGEMEALDFGDLRIILVNNEPLLMEYGGKYYVSVYGAIKLKPEKFKVVVDSGATDFIMNGADVMKPGIVSADPRIKEKDFVYVTVEPKDVPIAVGIALCNAEDMKGKGKAVKNLHHVKDKVWRDLVERKLIL
ncbi:MAG: PUA domain-containing protein [Archaeoglobaceae archaeon]